MALIIEMILVCALFTLMFILGNKKNPLSGLHNMPVELQERVASLPQYENVKVVRTKERILKKLPALIVLIILFVALIYISGARTFLQGFLNAFLLWLVIKLYVVFVLECGWYAHTPSAWIPGTEDMKECYQNYVFYIKSIPRSLAVGLVAAAIVGGIVAGISNLITLAYTPMPIA